MKRKPNNSVCIVNSVKFNFIKLEVLKLLKQRSALHTDELEKSMLELYLKVNFLQSFHSRAQSYCFFTGRSRGIYLNFISRYKLREYHGNGLLIGLRKTH